jgi:hypothetical protein
MLQKPIPSGNIRHAFAIQPGGSTPAPLLVICSSGGQKCAASYCDHQVTFINRMLNQQKILPYHLIVISILPVISLYAHNIEQVSFKNTLRAYVVFLLVTMVAFKILSLITRKTHLTALALSYGLVLFYTVVPIQTLLIKAHLEDISRIRYLLPIFAVVFIAGVWAGREKIRHPERLTRIANILALSTLVLPLFQISSYLIKIIPETDRTEKSFPSIQSNLPSKTNSRALPDVYLIVLDAHGRSDDIKRELGYDNTHFLEQLEQMGFYVARCSNSNYPDSTLESMFATLNMQFMDHNQIRIQTPAKTRSDWQYGIKHNQVISRFKQLGYKFVNFNTTYDALNFTDADVFYDFVYFPGTKIKHLNGFESLLLTEIPVGLQIDIRHKVHYENVRQVLMKLPQIPKDVSSPKFIYAHIVVPHFPYVFSPTGEYLAQDQDEFSAERYVNQVAYIDKQMVAIAKQIITDSTIPPIIVIQGDHGFPSKGITTRTSGILNVYYLPWIDYSEHLYQTISPVNSFRLIFNLYFDQNMSLLKDDIYRDPLGPERIDDENAPYHFSPHTIQDNCANGS